MKMNLETKLKLKNRILYDFAQATTYFVLYKMSIEKNNDLYKVVDNICLFNDKIINSIKNNIDNYHELKLAQLLLLFNSKCFNCPKDLFNLVLDKLIEKRIDPTLQTSFEIYNLNIDSNEWQEIDDINKYILWAELSIDIEYPIHRGFGFNIYEKDNIFYKEYYLPEGKFTFCAEIIEKPIYLITGHTIYSGKLKNYKYKGVLPKKPVYPVFTDNKEKVLFEVNKNLKHLGIKERLLINNLVLAKQDNKDNTNYLAIKKILQKASEPYYLLLKAKFL